MTYRLASDWPHGGYLRGIRGPLQPQGAVWKPPPVHGQWRVHIMHALKFCMCLLCHVRQTFYMLSSVRQTFCMLYSARQTSCMLCSSACACSAVWDRLSAFCYPVWDRLCMLSSVRQTFCMCMQCGTDFLHAIQSKKMHDRNWMHIMLCVRNIQQWISVMNFSMSPVKVLEGKMQVQCSCAMYILIIRNIIMECQSPDILLNWEGDALHGITLVNIEN